MCGIVAVLNADTYTRNTDDFMRDAMIASQVRGVDSSGIFQVDRKDALFMYKSPQNASTFVANRTAEGILFDVPNCPLTVGHVRAATTGVVATNNSHPFKAYRDDGSFIIGVHNGTLQMWRGRTDANLHQVDSEWAINMIATHGTAAFEMFLGAYAFLWWDSSKPDKLFAARNKERTLYYMVTKKKESILMASELGMLGWIASRNDLELEDNTTHYYLEPNFLYEFDLKDIGVMERSDLPAYDSTKGYSSLSAMPVIAAPVAAPTPMYHYRNDYGFPGVDDDYSDYYNYYSGTRRGYEDEQESLLSIIKTELAKARTTQVKSENVHTDEDLDRALTEAILKQDDLEEPPFDVSAPITPVDTGDVVLTNCVDGTCTREEVQRAKDLNIYGMVVNFTGIWYDKEGSVLYGQYPQWEGGQCTTYESAVRFVTSKQALDIYINNNRKAVPMVVIGTDQDIETIYLAPLTVDQKRFLEASRVNEGVH